MSGNSFANQDVMEDYMSALLTEEPIAKEMTLQSVELLLQNAPIPTTNPLTKITLANTDPSTELKSLPIAESVISKVIQSEVEEILTLAKPTTNIVKPVIPVAKFQVLLFEAAGMTLAVPLIELGGIHKIDRVNPLVGKPDWFQGVMLHRNEKYNVVNTASWIMSKKSAEKLAGSTKYQYLIVLGDSGWGVACENLVATETLIPDDVKWRNVETSRPWLSGMIKKKMCALLNVQQMINMLNQGLSSYD